MDTYFTYSLEVVPVPIPSNRQKHYWGLKYNWILEDGSKTERFLRLDNPNAVNFMVDMLKRLGYKKI